MGAVLGGTLRRPLAPAAGKRVEKHLAHILVAPNAEPKNEHASQAIDGVRDVPDAVGAADGPRDDLHDPRDAHQQEKFNVEGESVLVLPVAGRRDHADAAALERPRRLSLQPPQLHGREAKQDHVEHQQNQNGASKIQQTAPNT